MKKIYTIILLLAIALPSCNDWLDINPELEMRETLVFDSEQGFKDVLTGAYIRMATPSLYGLNTTVLLPEFMTRHWTRSLSSPIMTQAGNLDFTQTEGKAILETIWLQYYQTIINLNALLAEIDARQDLFSYGNHDLIKGEATGLRAFLHLEVLRLWGVTPRDMVMSDKAIPYVTVVTKNPNALLSLTYREVLDKILADLDEAERLLANDPILLYSNTVLNSIGTTAGVNENNPHPEDEFHYFRQVRFNYFAVKATKARYYSWIGNAARAAELALEVINAQSSDGTVQFTLGSEMDAGLGQLTFPAEHVFAVSNSLATQTITLIFNDAINAYTQNAAQLQTAYESTLHTGDSRFRNNRLWEAKQVPLSTGTFNFFKKYRETETTCVTDMPLIRLAEMYLIAVEGGNIDLFRTYRIARGLDASIDGTLVDDDAVMARLEKEYRKEFYGEGQMFFFYKRLRYERFTWPTPVKEISAASYRLPIPESQSMFE
ncbi:MAG: RagB/SusD family nutrient uptake outer membrane protein [Odoribacteraceae bacterium]|jgi:hypothetical protein|nr:RagB/SusD family nutrient uptake outer membrane protein [Odoribacteraceae bacterium]